MSISLGRNDMESHETEREPVLLCTSFNPGTLETESGGEFQVIQSYTIKLCPPPKKNNNNKNF